MRYAQYAGRTVLATLLAFALWGAHPARAQQMQVDAQQGKVGETITFTVSLDKATNTVDALGLILTYDPQVLRYTKIFRRGALVQGFDFFNVHEGQLGQIRVGGFTTKKAITKGGSGNLVSLTFTVLATNTSSVQIIRALDDLSGLGTKAGTFTAH